MTAPVPGLDTPREASALGSSAPTNLDRQSSARAGSDYYQVLGVPFEATEEQIRTRYHAVVRTLHPDRRRPGTAGSGEMQERFHQVQTAWQCLSNPTRRLLYDLRNFRCSSLGSEEAAVEIERRQKLEAERDLKNMEVTLEKVLRRERKAQGILVKQAFYGDLRLREECLEEGMKGMRTIEPKDLVGPVLDVTLPLQCLVEQHTIILPGGASLSKADLPGFYNPAPLDQEVELGLYALYEFRGHMHEVMVGDRETLKLPYRNHAVPAGKDPRGPFSPANAAVLRTRLQNSSVSMMTPRAKSKPLAGASTSTRIPKQVEGDETPAQALMRAVVAYRFDSLLGRTEGEATPNEFLTMMLGTGMAALVTMVWIRCCSGKLVPA